VSLTFRTGPGRGRECGGDTGPAAHRAWLEFAAAHGADEDEVGDGSHYRIARGALTNVVQQARAGNVRVELVRGGRVAADGRR